MDDGRYEHLDANEEILDGVGHLLGGEGIRVLGAGQGPDDGALPEGEEDDALDLRRRRSIERTKTALGAFAEGPAPRFRVERRAMLTHSPRAPREPPGGQMKPTWQPKGPPKRLQNDVFGLTLTTRKCDEHTLFTIL